MPVHRLIFRLDFSLNFALVDKPGTAMRLMDDMPGQSRPEIREASAGRQIQANIKSDRESLTFTVEPRSINFTLESLRGFDLPQLAEDSEFLRCTRLVKSYCDEFHIRTIQRAGFRVFSFDSLSVSKETRNKQLLGVVDTALVSFISKQLGAISDCGLAFDGQNANGISFHLRLGPFSRDETRKYLKEFPDEFDPEKTYDSVLDLDLYEEDFAAPNVSWHKHLQPYIDTAAKVITSVNATTSS